MTRVVAVATMLAALFGAASLAFPTLVYACSGDVEPVEFADVIVVGRTTDIALAPELEGRGTPRTLAVRVRFDVDRYLKGSGPTVIEAFDVASAEFPFDVPESE